MSYQLFHTAFFFVHIEVAYQLITSLDCPKFKDHHVFAEDLTRECFTEDSLHKNFLINLVLPFGIAWLIVVPLLEILLKRHQKHNISKLMECNWTITKMPLED